jgi:hypothetical protein
METIQIAQTNAGTTAGTTEQTTSTLAEATSEKFLSKEQYLLMKATWASTKCHSAADIIIYNVLRSFVPSRGFTPLTDRKVTSRSNDKWDGFNKALWGAKAKTSATKGKYQTEEHFKAQNEVALKNFSTTFGIDLTSDIAEAIKEVSKL